MPTTAAAALCGLITAWSARWHALTETAEVISDPAGRSRLLAMAEGLEACDLDARRAVREIVTGTADR